QRIRHDQRQLGAREQRNRHAHDQQGQREELPVREVDDPHDAEDQRQAQREQYVCRGDLHTVRDQLHVDVQLVSPRLVTVRCVVYLPAARRCWSSCGTTRSTSTSLPSWICVIMTGTSSCWG